MAKKTSPTQRTIARLKKQGVKCGIVEKWIQFGEQDPRANVRPGFRKDLFGIIDIIALIPKTGVLGIQCTGQSGFRDHWDKLTVDKRQDSLDWLVIPGTMLQIWAWRKLKKVRGGKAYYWEPRIEAVTIMDLKIEKPLFSLVP